jgi:hypothetical protein
MKRGPVSGRRRTLQLVDFDSDNLDEGDVNNYHDNHHQPSR